MNNQDYTVRIAANVSARDAFNSINRVSDWWATHFEGHSEKLNDVFTVRFGETFVTFKIIDMVPIRRSSGRFSTATFTGFAIKKSGRTRR